ncbi:hypothetical protein [Virgibacillus halodenitrificans]|uniref:DUF4083 domain-containing protein n=1 Tax=Virgibacillus halodenitrificans TaxID=1482 RepID=A0ABR7VMV9_VIRHA|nr:hypothetical protein [Virgibacillus halodenitrificans]MBD1222167.1 hypothetical protein [Virgibacillus halodenitrificans]MCJ0930672.1 hypothetical protein [Virgibacillus halodenitrificans]MYL58102.1 hypothetical protein [Virgibacillus halodenitrificans]
MEFLALFSFLFIYIGIPLAIIFFLKQINEIKENSELHSEQNKQIIQLLKQLRDSN